MSDNTTAAKLVLRAQRSDLVPAWLRRLMLNAVGADLHPLSEIRPGCHFSTPRIRMGKGAFLSYGAQIDNTEWVTIGVCARVGPRLRVITRDHAVTTLYWRRSSPNEHIHGEVVIGCGAKLGMDCAIVPGVTIAHGCVYGMCSTIVQSSEPNGFYINRASSSGAVYAQFVRELESRPW